jgi:myo-inositol-1(or 4)-monophosphatase
VPARATTEGTTASRPGSPIDPLGLLELATTVGQRAADLLLEGARLTRTSVATKSSLTDMVTEMDRASEELIVTALLEARPDDGILAEEGSARQGTSGVRWVIDPLDGTTNYLYGHPGWAVSIAAELTGGAPAAEDAAGRDDSDGVGGGHGTHGPSSHGDLDGDGVVAGVVIDAVHGEVYTAARGHGAHRNGEPLRCSDQADVGQALVATGFGYAAERRRVQAEVLVDLLPQVRDIRRMGSASVDMCSVACGRVDAYYERGLSWWDWAAGLLVARESGAIVTTLDPAGRPPGPGVDSVVVAGPALIDPLSALLRSVGAHRVP